MSHTGSNAAGPQARVVIAGGGQAGCQAAMSLRQAGFAGGITIVSDEDRPPYQRPPLSKAYLGQDQPFERLLLRPADFFAANAIALRLGDGVAAIDRAAGVVDLRSGARLGFDHLVLALGARNRVLPIEGADLAGVHSLRTAADAERLRAALGGAARLVVVGGGFIGLEVAASASARGLDVTVLEASGRLMGRVVSPAISDFFLKAHRAMGTAVRLGATVLGLRGRASVQAVETADGAHPADLVLLAAGVVPNAEIATDAGLTVSGGVRVDAFMTTDDPRIFAVGDCAVFDSRHADGLVRLESVQNAVDQARCVAARIMGGTTPYDSVPWFWSDQGRFKLQIAGMTQRADHVHISGSEEEGRIAACCFRADTLIGIETVNRPGDHMAGRKLLSLPVATSRGDLERRGFDLRAHLEGLPA